MKQETILEALRRRLRESGATQTEIAAATGIGQSTIGRVLRGESEPTAGTMQSLLDWLGPERKRPGRKPRYAETRA
jgi:transcriptional regulator with XRE-family HTH domain